MPNPDAYNTKPSRLVHYSTSWCPDCKRTKALLENQNIDHLEIDIGQDLEAYAFVEKLTRRVRTPTLIFPDGTILIEPSDEALSRQLGVS